MFNLPPLLLLSQMLHLSKAFRLFSYFESTFPKHSLLMLNPLTKTFRLPSNVQWGDSKPQITTTSTLENMKDGLTPKQNKSLSHFMMQYESHKSLASSTYRLTQCVSFKRTLETGKSSLHEWALSIAMPT